MLIWLQLHLHFPLRMSQPRPLRPASPSANSSGKQSPSHTPVLRFCLSPVHTGVPVLSAVFSTCACPPPHVTVVSQDEDDKKPVSGPQDKPFWGREKDVHHWFGQTSLARCGAASLERRPKSANGSASPMSLRRGRYLLPPARPRTRPPASLPGEASVRPSSPPPRTVPPPLVLGRGG